MRSRSTRKETLEEYFWRLVIIQQANSIQIGIKKLIYQKDIFSSKFCSTAPWLEFLYIWGICWSCEASWSLSSVLQSRPVLPALWCQCKHRTSEWWQESCQVGGTTSAVILRWRVCTSEWYAAFENCISAVISTSKFASSRSSAPGLPPEKGYAIPLLLP